MSSLISESDLSQQAPERDSDNSGHDQYVTASSPESVKAMLRIQSTSTRNTSLNPDTRALKLYRTLEQMTKDVLPGPEGLWSSGSVLGVVLG
ncbi:hypothetical protein DHEL01_v204383 [Diaporthe helianthi]|uniref:Uncharacterized protein n=1 Tax=Diaporthe helianthi TaxID=158607 RepID=A0A2P5I3Y2_DIAHE|nr:hypothetical protein DHEL01_v204383 [Diaporthe helianthi]